MAGSTLIVFELFLVFGVVIAFCAWELYSLGKDRHKPGAKDGDEPDREKRNLR